MKRTNLIERMKTKNFYIVIGFVVLTSGSLWLLNYPSPAFQNIVTKTHKGIKNLPNNINIQNQHELTVDPQYLSRLGLNRKFVDTPSSSEDALHSIYNIQPIIASSVVPEKMEDAILLMNSVGKHLPNHQLVIYDLGLSQTDLFQLKKYCNNTWNCNVQTLDFKKYPSHIADLAIRSYRPICIQEMLNTYGAVVWVDPPAYFQSGNLTDTLSQAKKVGLVAWTIEDPTSAITHPKMFQFFKTSIEPYYFHRAVESSRLVLFRTPLVEEKIMLPWVKCALLEDCINPTGAQNVGCNFLRKPLFLYSGCHYYDMSALNIILGPLFDFDERAYAGKENVFGNMIEDRLAAKNASDPLFKSRLKLRAYLNGKAPEG